MFFPSVNKMISQYAPNNFYDNNQFRQEKLISIKPDEKLLHAEQAAH